MVRKQGPRLQGVPQPLMSVLVVVAVGMFTICMYTPISTGVNSTRKEDAGKSTLDKAPTPSELKLMTWQDEHRVVNKVQIIKECVQHNLCSKLHSKFGLGTADLKEHVKKNPQYCCQTVFQKWCVRGSNPKDAYPISWKSVIKVLNEVGLHNVAVELRTVLLQIGDNIL